MNKKGFTLIELIAVIVVLALIVIIVATNGFGAFNNSKEAIFRQNEKTIKEAANLLMVEVQNCIDSEDNELLYKDGNGSDISALLNENAISESKCEKLKEKAQSEDGLTIRLDFLWENKYVTNKGVEEILKEYPDYTVTGYLKADQKIEIDVPEIEEPIEYDGEAILKNFGNSGIAGYAPFSSYKNNIISISFLNTNDYSRGIKIDGNKKNVVVSDSTSENPIYAWLEKDTSDNTKYHLYFGTDNKEIYANSNSAKLFAEFTSVKTIDFKNFNTSNVRYMNGMFFGMHSLEKLDLSNFDTSNVIYMYEMFEAVWSLQELDLSNFDTSNVIKMSEMFYNMNSLKKLNINSFDTSKVKSMKNMFMSLNLLPTLTFGDKFDTSNVTDMSSMFSGMSSLTELDVSNFDTSNVTDMSYMFAFTPIKELGLNNFDTSNVTKMHRMFNEMSFLTELDLSSFNTRNVKDMSWMFSDMNSLTKLDISSFDTSNVTTMRGMFSKTKKLTNLDISNFDTSSVTTMREMFSNMDLTTLDLSSFNTENVEDMSYMFNEMNNLTNLTFGDSFDTSNVTNMSEMFYYTRVLTTLDLSKFDISNLAVKTRMFYYSMIDTVNPILYLSESNKSLQDDTSLNNKVTVTIK